jgi:hypothetical protein
MKKKRKRYISRQEPSRVSDPDISLGLFVSSASEEVNLDPELFEHRN